MAAPISASDVAHVARLARLDLTPAEVELFAGQLAGVLEHAAEVAALDTTGVEPTSHPLALRNVLREDVPQPCLSREEVLSQAPEAEAGQFRVPRILA
ncbi:MAG: Asp-tRNA(Asn)/Glu-tRNA(Gln) amidotransferase subunit GatC [Acidimicrobiales bacterium]